LSDGAYCFGGRGKGRGGERGGSGVSVFWGLLGEGLDLKFFLSNVNQQQQSVREIVGGYVFFFQSC
jgi:hypothetical protein